MIAIKRLQSIFWILLVALGGLSAYLVSLRVAAERNAVRALDIRIAQARADMRYLETEFEARASMRQLEKWNVEDYRFVAPSAEQYLPGEQALAKLDGVPANGDTYVAPPVMMAMAENGVPESAGLSTAPPAKAAAASTPRAASVPDAPAAIERAARAAPASLPPLVKQALARVEPKAERGGPAAAATSRHGAQVAMLDAKLLDDRTLSDLGIKAAAEARTRGGR